jgi:hypothetical protein
MFINPALHVVFTCTHCDTRSQRRMSRQAYSSGVVLIRCPGCQQLHLFADHLGWFSDGRETIEDIMREKGITVRKIGGAGEEEGQDSTADGGSSRREGEQPLGAGSRGAVSLSGLRVDQHDGIVEVVKDTGENGAAERQSADAPPVSK